MTFLLVLNVAKKGVKAGRKLLSEHSLAERLLELITS
jgi:hypothetical protein